MPLVTVVVCTYNSGKYITDALYSIKHQTYNAIELIVSDDASVDDTLKIVRDWIAISENRDRFVRVMIMESPENTGISANANRGLHASEGDWIIFLAGDDGMKPHCIEDNMHWVSQNTEARILFSRVAICRNSFEDENIISITEDDSDDPRSIMAASRSAESQYRMLLISDRIHYTPSAFINRKTLNSVGGFDERFKLLEDHPLWLNLTRNGHRLNFMNKITVNYRQHSAAVNNTGTTFLVNPNYFKYENFRKIYIYPNLPLDVRLFHRYSWLASQLFRIEGFNKNSRANRIIYRLLTTYLNPLKYYLALRKSFVKELADNEFYQ
jgi:glycosyltransferase involved in cell wall biosynthesis